MGSCLRRGRSKIGASEHDRLEWRSAGILSLSMGSCLRRGPSMPPPSMESAGIGVRWDLVSIYGVHLRLWEWTTPHLNTSSLTPPLLLPYSTQEAAVLSCLLFILRIMSVELIPSVWKTDAQPLKLYALISVTTVCGGALYTAAL